MSRSHPRLRPGAVVAAAALAIVLCACGVPPRAVPGATGNADKQPDEYVTVHDPEGHPLAGVAVHVYGADGKVVIEGHTDGQGRWDPRSAITADVVRQHLNDDAAEYMVVADPPPGYTPVNDLDGVRGGELVPKKCDDPRACVGIIVDKDRHAYRAEDRDARRGIPNPNARVTTVWFVMRRWEAPPSRTTEQTAPTTTSSTSTTLSTTTTTEDGLPLPPKPTVKIAALQPKETTTSTVPPETSTTMRPNRSGCSLEPSRFAGATRVAVRVLDTAERPVHAASVMLTTTDGLGGLAVRTDEQGNAGAYSDCDALVISQVPARGWQVVTNSLGGSPADSVTLLVPQMTSIVFVDGSMG